MFGCTPFGSDDSLQTFLLAIYKLLALLSWYFLPLFLCIMFKLLNSCRFLASHFKTVHFFLFNHSCVLLDVYFGSLSCWRTHALRLKPGFFTLGRTFHPKIA